MITIDTAQVDEGARDKRELTRRWTRSERASPLRHAAVV